MTDKYGEIAFTGAVKSLQETMCIASVSATGRPYVQPRGGPYGFLRVVDEATLGSADFRGNKQSITAGNIAGDDRVALLLIDFAHRRRLKIFGHMRGVDLAGDPALAEALIVPGHPVVVERGSSSASRRSTGTARSTSRPASRRRRSARPSPPAPSVRARRSEPMRTDERADAQATIVLASGEAPVFAPGDAVRVLTREPIGHYRVPTYLRGKTGAVVGVIQPAGVDNEEEGFGRNAGQRRHYYRVAFPMAEVWQRYAGSPRDGLYVEIFETWLERA